VPLVPAGKVQGGHTGKLILGAAVTVTVVEPVGAFGLEAIKHVTELDPGASAVTRPVVDTEITVPFETLQFPSHAGVSRPPLVPSLSFPAAFICNDCPFTMVGLAGRMDKLVTLGPQLGAPPKQVPKPPTCTLWPHASVAASSSMVPQKIDFI